MKHLITISALAFLFSCNKENKDPEPYIVVKIHEDSTDASGMKWNSVILKNSLFHYYRTCYNENEKVKIGDTIMIGHNAMGDYLLTKWQRPFKIESIRPVPPKEIK